jgi:hypothetical protein
MRRDTNCNEDIGYTAVNIVVVDMNQGFVGDIEELFNSVNSDLFFFKEANDDSVQFVPVKISDKVEVLRNVVVLFLLIVKLCIIQNNVPP